MKQNAVANEQYISNSFHCLRNFPEKLENRMHVPVSYTSVIKLEKMNKGYKLTISVSWLVLDFRPL